MIDINSVLHEEIPVSKKMGIKFKDYNELGLILTAPLADNINHKNTAFGGSISTILILSAWSYLYYELRLRAIHGEIIIQKSETSYLKGIRSDFEAICEHPSSIVMSRFLKTLDKYGKARIKLDARINSNEEILADFSGLYVVIKNNLPPGTR